jgi:archaellum component FlaD/FlaE
MRYIKLFEGFNEDKEKLSNDISGSLVELYDKGFDIQVSVSTNSIIVEIKKQESFEGEFMFDEIEDEVKQLCDYMSEKYNDLEIDYSPETRWANYSYSSLEEIPEDIIFSDIIAFDLFFINKSGYFTEKTIRRKT